MDNTTSLFVKINKYQEPEISVDFFTTMAVGYEMVTYRGNQPVPKPILDKLCKSILEEMSLSAASHFLNAYRDRIFEIYTQQFKSHNKNKGRGTSTLAHGFHPFTVTIRNKDCYDFSIIPSVNGDDQNLTFSIRVTLLRDFVKRFCSVSVTDDNEPNINLCIPELMENSSFIINAMIILETGKVTNRPESSSQKLPDLCIIEALNNSPENTTPQDNEVMSQLNRHVVRNVDSKKENAKHSDVEAFDIFEEAKQRIFNKKVSVTDEITDEIAELANSFDATDVKSILGYGRIATMHTDGSVDDLLDKFQGHDMREATRIISEMVQRAGELDMQPLTKGDSVLSRIFTFVKTQEERLENFKQDYNLTSKSFKELGTRLDTIKTRLVDNVEQLRKLFYKNLEQIKMIEQHIEALEVRKSMMSHEIELCKAMEEGVFKSEYGVDFSSVNNFFNSISDQLQRKIDSLRLVLITTRQTSPQLETISKTNVVLACNIQETLDTILPLWKKQFALGIQVVEQQLAGDITGGIDEMTNKALVDTARLTEMSAIDAATMMSGNKGRVSIEALNVVQHKLLDQLKKTTAIEHAYDDEALAKKFKKIGSKETEDNKDNFLTKLG